jgi:hypothetical protein
MSAKSETVQITESAAPKGMVVVDWLVPNRLSQFVGVPEDAAKYPNAEPVYARALPLR